MQNYDCVRCKGARLLCGRARCPRVERAKAAMELVKVARHMQAPSPTVFVGRVGYPRIRAGPMMTRFPDPDFTNAPEQWYGTPLEDLAGMRFQLVRSKKALDVHAAKDPSRQLMDFQDVAMSSHSIATEVLFRSPPSFNPRSLSEITAPYGPSGDLSRLSLAENPRVPRKVDKVVSDDLKAVDGMASMYDGKVPVSRISALLSVGLLGEEKARKLVPTRWSITATDDTLGKKLIEEIKDFSELDEYLLFSDTYLGNHFEVLLAPGRWSFENIEVYVPGNIWLDPDRPLRFMKDWEPYSGRTNYANSVTGAYYACRLGCCEYLKRTRKQATVIVVREVTPSYWCPVGVWVIRETVRHALTKTPVRFETLKKADGEIGNRLMTKSQWEKESEILSRLKSREVFKEYLGNS